MRCLFKMGIVAVVTLNSVCAARAEEDLMQFYSQEAQVVSASHQPQPANQAPATVYVVTQEDIKASGAQTLWDALRSVPGLDVMTSRTSQGDVDGRGLNLPLNRRTLVLMDGYSVQNKFFDHVVWEALPVDLAEIDRIEVVEGPVSAVYGANAVSTVINIITKTPEALNGGQVRYAGGERETQNGYANFGKKQGHLSYKVGGAYRTTNRFENADLLAGQNSHFQSLLNYELSDHSAVEVSGRVAHYYSVVSIGSGGTMVDTGENSFMQGVYHWRETKFETLWSRLRSDVSQNALTQNSFMNDDAYDVNLEQGLSLPFRNHAVFGGGYRRINAQSQLLVGNSASQDLWSAFLEDKWEIAQKWMLMASGRVDRHPLTPLHFSPRGSLLYTPVPEHVFRLTAGSAFRNPALLENYAVFRPAPVPVAPPPGFTGIQNTLVGNTSLDPERFQSIELGHTGRFGRFKTTATGFYYEYRDGIGLTNSVLTGPPIPPTLNLQNTFVNVTDAGYGWGGNLGIEYLAASWLRLMGNYSYLGDYGVGQAYDVSLRSPRHKANIGFRTKNEGLTTQWMLNWVDKTKWSVTPGVGDVNAYFLLNAYAGYAFSGRFNGLEAGISAFNLLQHDHYELSPVQGGELIRSRLMGSLTYKF